VPGTPTSRLGLPTIDGGSDLIPDGDDQINAALQALDAAVATDGQGAAGSRPVSTTGTPGKRGRWYYSTDTRKLERDTGTGWTRMRTEPAVVTAPLAAGSRADGEEVYLQNAAMAAQKIKWLLKWNQGLACWDFLGGGRWLVGGGYEQLPGWTVNVWGFHDNGDVITLPALGVYDVHFGARVAAVGSSASAVRVALTMSTAASWASADVLGPETWQEAYVDGTTGTGGDSRGLQSASGVARINAAVEGRLTIRPAYMVLSETPGTATFHRGSSFLAVQPVYLY
jgi:hypothetical protein